MIHRKPLKTRTITPTHNEKVETPCESCEERELRVIRVEVETHEAAWDIHNYLSVKLRCKCLNCGFKQIVQLVEMP